MADLGTLALGTFDAVNSTDTAIVGSNPVLEVIASADDTDYVHDNTNSTHTGVAYFALGDTPSDFATMDTLSIQLRYGWQTGTQTNTWTSLTAQVYQSDRTTALTDSRTVASSITTTTPTNSGALAFTGVQAGSKTIWDGAVVAIRFNITRNKGGDSLTERVYAAEITGTYTAGGTPATVTPGAIARSFATPAATPAGGAVVAPDGIGGGGVAADGYLTTGTSSADRAQTTQPATAWSTGTIELITCVRQADWYKSGFPTYQFVQHRGQMSFAARANDTNPGVMQFRYHDGSVLQTIASNAVIPGSFTSADWVWFRFVIVPGSYTGDYYYSLDPTGTAPGSVSWTQVGTQVSGTALTIRAAATTVTSVGGDSSLTGADPHDADFTYARLSLNGSVVWDTDFRDADQGWDSPPATDTSGNAWSFNGVAAWTAPVAGGGLAFTIPTATAFDSGAAGSTSPAATARTFTVDAVTVKGGAVVTPAATARTFTVDQATPEGGAGGTPATVTPDPVARVFTVDQATPAGPAVATPAATARSFTVDAVTVTASAVANPAATARSFTVPAVTVATPATVTPDATARTFTLPVVSPAGGAATTPGTVALAFTVDQVSVAAGAVTTPATIALNVDVNAVTTVTGGAGSVSPNAIARTFTVDQATVEGGAVVTVAASDIAAFVNQAAVAGAAAVSPATTARSFTVGAVTISGGAITTPDATGATTTLPAVTVVGAATTSPDVILLAFTVPSATTANGDNQGLQDGGLTAGSQDTVVVVAVQASSLRAASQDSSLSVGAQE